MLRVMLVAGARPNFIKIASIHDAIERRNSRGAVIQSCLVHTGQHYDAQMSQAFFDDLALPRPDVDLGVGSGSHAHQTAEVMKRFEPVLMERRPDLLVVVGDVNSTVACSLVAAKVSYPVPAENGRTRPLIAHVEAGLRSFDRSMPEEVNRILTDALSDLLFITEPSARKNLLREGVPADRIHFVGNTMVDTLLKHRRKAKQSSFLDRLGLRVGRGGKPPGGAAAVGALGPRSSVRQYAVVTLHRPSNVDEPEALASIMRAIRVVAKRMPVFFPVHPRTRKRICEYGFEGYLSFRAPGPPTNGEMVALEPLGYLDFLCLMSHARLVLTDSGGIQEETTMLRIPCVTLRPNTERPVTIEEGTNVLAGTREEDIVRQAHRQLERRRSRRRPRFWDGRAGERIVRVVRRLESRWPLG